MIIRALIIICLVFLVATGEALGQGNQCRTGPPGAKSPNCASEAFVTSSSYLSNIQASKSGNYSAVQADCNSTMPLGGATFYTFTISAPANYTVPCSFFLVNEDSVNGRSIVVSGMTTFILFPLTSVLIFKTSSAWRRFP